MKILLLGEFSSFHNLLKEGLQEIGHEVVLASSGDGYRNVKRDIDLAKNRSWGLLKDAEHAVRLFQLSNEFKGFDVVQLMSPIIFPMKFGINEKLLKKLKENNNKLYLVGAGASTQNTIIADFLQNHFKYPQLYKLAKTEELKEMWSQTDEGRKYNSWLHDLIDGYIPIMYEYAEGYRMQNHEKLKKTIPIPANIDEIQYVGCGVKKKIRIFHGISRADKGTKLISEALENVENKYPNDVEVILKGNLPLKQYLEILDSTNIVIDQTYAVSYGVNAVYNLAKGKIVLGGGEEECLKEFGITHSPMIPISPDVKDIELKIEELIAQKTNLDEIGFASRKYAEEIHDYKNVASDYIKTWSL